MDKPYRRLRAKARKRKEEPSSAGTWFLLRMFVCLVAFLAFAGVKMRGGEVLAWAKNQADFYLSGAAVFSQAYEQSVEAINQFCDRILEEPQHD